MDAKILKDIKDTLLQRRVDLEKKLAAISDKGEAAYVDIEDDEDVNAQEVSQYSDNLSLVAELKKNLDDVNKSLARIEEKGYGVCKYCKQDINPERLKVRPASGSCVECKTTLQGGAK